MAMNEDWSSVFLQALSNSMAQSKAESKWNQELAFRDKQFGLDIQKFEADKQYNQDQLGLQKTNQQISWLNNYTPVTTDFGVLPNYGPGETPLTDPVAIYNKFLASRYGGAVDNPLTPEKDYFIPNTSFNAINADRRAGEGRAAELAKGYISETDALPTIGGFQGPVKDMANLAKIKDVSGFYADTDKLWTKPASGTYYDRNALGILGGQNIEWQKAQREIDAANYRAQLSHSASMAGINLERERMNPIQTFKVPDGNGGFTYVDGTAKEIKAKYKIAAPASEEEAFAHKIWQDIYGEASKYGINPTDGYTVPELNIIAEAMAKKGGHISNAPWLTDSANNAIYNAKKEEWKSNPGSTAFGSVLNGPLGYIPFQPGSWLNLARTVLPDSWINFGDKRTFGEFDAQGGNDTPLYNEAMKLQNSINRNNTTNASAQQVINDWKQRNGIK